MPVEFEIVRIFLGTHFLNWFGLTTVTPVQADRTIDFVGKDPGSFWFHLNGCGLQTLTGLKAYVFKALPDWIISGMPIEKIWVYGLVSSD